MSLSRRVGRRIPFRVLFLFFLTFCHSVKNSPATAGDARDMLWSLDLKDPLEEEMETHSSILTWEIPQTEELGGLQSTGSQRVGHNWATILSLFRAALFTLAKIWKQAKCPSASEQIKKMWYTHNGILLSHTKEQNNAVCNNMNGPRDYHTKSERERQISYHLHVESKTWYKWTYLQNRNRLTSLSMIISRSIPVAANDIISFFLMAE